MVSGKIGGRGGMLHKGSWVNPCFTKPNDVTKPNRENLSHA